MAGRAQISDVYRLIRDEQRAALSRWDVATRQYSEDLRALISGRLPAVDFGLDLVDHAVEETILTARGAARIGMGYTRWLAGIRLGSEPDTHDASHG
jgi:hypothetical protein